MMNQLNLQKYLIKDCSIRVPASEIRFYLLETHLKEAKCEVCGLSGLWRGQPIPFQLHHLNGDNRDNRLENLQILCPNCHSQTDNFCQQKGDD